MFLQGKLAVDILERALIQKAIRFFITRFEVTWTKNKQTKMIYNHQG